MRYSILILLVVAGCTTNPVDTPGGGQTPGTLLIDRTGITDSVHLDSTANAEIIFINQSFSFGFDTMQIVFNYAGTSGSRAGLVSMREMNTGYFYDFGSSFSANTSYQTMDTTFALTSFNGTLQAYLGCTGNPANNVWFAIRDLKIYGK